MHNKKDKLTANVFEEIGEKDFIDDYLGKIDTHRKISDILYNNHI